MEDNTHEALYPEITGKLEQTGVVAVLTIEDLHRAVPVARALVNDPDLIIADEPTGSLDSQSSREIMSLFRSLNVAGKTIVMVTHEEEAARHAGHIVRMRDGRISN